MTTESAEGVELERDKRFSESLVWDLQRRYYAEKGPAAWHSGEVPSYATCNTFIAKSYVNVTLAYLRDARAAGLVDATKPIYIVELAAGVGRFAFQFLNKLRQAKATSSLRDLDIRYVMTDFNATNPEVWSKHPHLTPFVDEGLLQLGRFDVDSDREIALLGGGSLSAATVDNPVIVVANYAFDTFRADLFKFAEGKTHEVVVSARTPGPVTDPRDPALMPTLRLDYNARPITGAYYGDGPLDRTLAYFAERLSDTTIALPVGGFRGLAALMAIAKNRLLLLSSDKGYTQEDELYSPHQHGMQLHGTAFSLMVNYPAIGRWFMEQGGWQLSTSRRSLQLKTTACIVGGDEARFADTMAVAEQDIEEFGPGEFFEMLQHERQDQRPKSIPHFLNLLRLSGYDPGVLWDHAPQIRQQAASLNDGQALELRIGIDRAWQNYYPGPQNLPFELARIFMTLRRPVEAIRYGRLSIEWFGPSPASFLNLGISYYYAENPDEARRCFEQALEINPTWGLAREWIARLKAEAIVSRGSAPSSAAPVVHGGGGIPSGPIASVSGPVSPKSPSASGKLSGARP